VTTPGPEWDFPYGPVDTVALQEWLADLFHSLYPDPRPFNEYFENESEARMAWWLRNQRLDRDDPFPKTTGAKGKLGHMWTDDS
jgi:hypothetical protein